MATEQTQNAPAPQDNKKAVSKFEEKTVDQILAQIANLQQDGGLVIPADYSAENAVRSAFLMLQDVKAKKSQGEYVPVLEHCTKHSIANAMLDMVIQGLSPVKKQCYFIAYGTKLQLHRSYLGTLAVARRVAGVDNVVANVVYEGDEFSFEVNVDNGRTKILKHSQSLDTIDNTKIKGVYTCVMMDDGSSNITIMTMPQVRAAWAQGQSKGQSDAHKNFPDEMAKKSCINRALKTLIGGTDDGALYDDDDAPRDTVASNIQHSIQAGANKTSISMARPAPDKKATDKPVERTYIQEEPETSADVDAKPNSEEENPPY